MERAIKTYGDIVKRIAEIIKISEDKKKEIDSWDIKENYNNYFSYILYYDIDVSFSDEFRQLIDSERTFNLINKESPITYLEKTQNLLLVCQEKANLNNGDYADYKEIARIINESYGKNALELTEYKGYYILREKFNKWIWLMRKLNLLPDNKKMSINERKEELEHYLFQNHEQYYRLQNFLAKIEDKDNIANLDKSKTFHINIKNKKHSDIIFLGISGKLKIDYLKELKFLYTDEEYQNLLAELLEWQIFSEEEINSLRTLEPKSTIVLDGNDSFDKLLRFLYKNGEKITDVNALRYLKPVIGEDNLKNLIDTLHMLGTISLDVYEEYLALNNDIVIKK